MIRKLEAGSPEHTAQLARINELRKVLHASIANQITDADANAIINALGELIYRVGHAAGFSAADIRALLDGFASNTETAFAQLSLGGAAPQGHA